MDEQEKRKFFDENGDHKIVVVSSQERIADFMNSFQKDEEIIISEMDSRVPYIKFIEALVRSIEMKDKCPVQTEKVIAGHYISDLLSFLMIFLFKKTNELTQKTLKREFVSLLKYYQFKNGEDVVSLILDLIKQKNDLLCAYQQECTNKSDRIVELEKQYTEAIKQAEANFSTLQYATSKLEKLEEYHKWITVPEAVRIVEDMVLVSPYKLPCDKETFRINIQNELKNSNCECIKVHGSKGNFYRVFDVATSIKKVFPNAFAVEQYMIDFRCSAITRNEISNKYKSKI